jgi:hypothetical protein
MVLLANYAISIRARLDKNDEERKYPGRTEWSVCGSKRIKYGIFTALRRISFTKIRLRYIYISITGGGGGLEQLLEGALRYVNDTMYALFPDSLEITSLNYPYTISHRII